MNTANLSVIDAYSQACHADPLLVRNSVLRKGIALYIWSTGEQAELHVPAVSELVLFVHLSGSHRAHMIDERGQSRKVSKPGDITLIPSRQQFRLRTGGEMEFAVMIFPATAPPPREKEPWFRLLGLSACVFAWHDDFVAANMHALIDAIKAPPRDGLQYFNQMFDSLVFHLARIVDEQDAQADEGVGSRKSPLLAMHLEVLLDYIEERLADKLSVEDLANHLGVGRSLFAREFRDQFGCAPHQYIVRRRIERAKVLLKNGGRVTDIAFELGFSGQSHFSTAFKAATGCSPRVYARKNI